MADSFWASIADKMSGKEEPSPKKGPSQVVVDDPNEGFVTMPYDVAQRAGYPALLGIRPDQVPKDPQKRAAMTALYRKKKADRLLKEAAQGRADKAFAEKNPETVPSPFVLADDGSANLTSMDPASAKRQGFKTFPDLDPDTIPAMDTPEMASLLARLRTPKAAPVVAPRPAVAAAAPPQVAVPVAAPPVAPPVAVPRAIPPPVDPDAGAKAWTQGFAPQASGFAPDESAALLALAKSGRPSMAPPSSRSVMNPESEGIATRPMSMPPPPAGATATGAQGYSERDAAALKALAEAQRSDDFSAGMGALGDQFREARDLILNIRSAQRASGRGSDAVRAVQERQAMAAAQDKAAREGKLAEATLAGKETAKTESAAKVAKLAAELETSKSDNDPTSPASRRAQAIVKEVLGQRIDPAVVDATPASQIGPLMLKYSVPVSNAETMASLGAQRNQMTGEQNDTANAMTSQRIALMEQELDLARERLKQQGEDTDANRTRLEKEAELKREIHADEKATKLAEKNVGGFTFNPSDPPSTNGAKTMADVAVARDEVLGSLGKLEGLYQKHGPTMIGPIAGEMETEWMNITNRLRTLNEMGVPNGADYLMLSKQLQDPTGIRAKGTSAARAKAQFENLREQVKRKVDATAKAYKYAPATQRPPDLDLSTDVKEPSIPGVTPPPAATPPPAVAQGGGARTVSIKGMKPGELKDSLKDGEQVRYGLGGGKFQVVQRKGDKLVKVRVE